MSPLKVLAPLTVTSTPVDAASVTILLPLVMKVPSSATSAVNFAPLPNTSTIPVWFVPLKEDPKMIWLVAPIINGFTFQQAFDLYRLLKQNDEDLYDDYN